MTELLPFFLFAISASFTPGPNNFLILNSGLKFGIKKSLPHFFGICFGFPIMILVVALGFGAVLTQYVLLKELFKFAGSAYMLYLAWKIWNAHMSNPSAQEQKPFSFLQAVMFQWINAKAWMISIGVISIFTLAENYLTNALMMSFFLFLICLPTVGAWLYFGVYLKRFLKEERHFKWFNRTMAVSLVASIALIFI